MYSAYIIWTMKETEHQRIDAFELWCWRRLLRVPWTARRSNRSIIKEISSEYSLEGLMLKLKLHWKIPWWWERFKAEGDDRGWDGWVASPTRWTWVWVNSGIWGWTGKPGMLQSMGLQRVRPDWATELNRLLWVFFILSFPHVFEFAQGTSKDSILKWKVHNVQSGPDTQWWSRHAIDVEGEILPSNLYSCFSSWYLVFTCPLSSCRQHPTGVVPASLRTWQWHSGSAQSWKCQWMLLGGGSILSPTYSTHHPRALSQSQASRPSGRQGLCLSAPATWAPSK